MEPQVHKALTELVTSIARNAEKAVKAMQESNERMDEHLGNLNKLTEILAEYGKDK